MVEYYETETQTVEVKKAVQVAQEEGLEIVIPITRQLAFSKVAHFCTNDNGNDLYFMLEAIRILRAEIGDKILKEKYGQDTPEVLAILSNFGEQVYKIKLYYDSLGNKELTELEKEKRIYKLYKKEVKKLNPFMQLPYDVFFLYFKSTNLKYQTAPNEYFKKSERKYTTFDLKRKERGEEEEPEEED